MLDYKEIFKNRYVTYRTHKGGIVKETKASKESDFMSADIMRFAETINYHVEDKRIRDICFNKLEELSLLMSKAIKLKYALIEENESEKKTNGKD